MGGLREQIKVEKRKWGSMGSGDAGGDFTCFLSCFSCGGAAAARICTTLCDIDESSERRHQESSAAFVAFLLSLFSWKCQMTQLGVIG